jgi:hypothetical protein
MPRVSRELVNLFELYKGFLDYLFQWLISDVLTGELNYS